MVEFSKLKCGIVKGLEILGNLGQETLFSCRAVDAHMIMKRGSSKTIFEGIWNK